MADTPPLRALDDPVALRTDIYGKVLDEFQKLPPLVGPKHTLSLHDVSYADPEHRHIRERKDAILTGKTLDRRLRGTWRLTDNATGKVVDERHQTIARVPHLNDAGTYVLNGVEHTLKNQLRLQPGIFARVRNNGEVEAHVNVIPGKGISHRLVLDPEEGIFRMEVGQARLPLLPILKLLGATDQQIREHWGPELLATNLRKGDGQALDKLHDKVIRRGDPNAPTEERHKNLAAALQAMELDPEVTQRTLGHPHRFVNADSLLAATGKLLTVGRGEAEPDDRDHPAYQNFMGPEDTFAERVRTAHRTLRPLLWRASAKGNLDPVLPNVLGRTVQSAITGSGLGQALEEVSPLDILNQFVGVSRMGVGGIPSEDSIPPEARNVQPGQYNYLDYLITPESLRAGVDTKLASSVKRGADGKLYAPYRDPRTGQIVYKTPQDVANLRIAFPGELASGNKHVKALAAGKLGYIRRRDVDLSVPDVAGTLSPAANLVPMVGNSKGQRGSMGARMLTQALPLEGAEAPLVQSGMPGQPDRSFEEHYGKWMGAVHADKPGTVVRTDPDEITVKHDDGTKQTYELANNLPLNRKTYWHQEALVKAGDRIDAKQLLAKSNFTDDKGVTALGLNARTAYIPAHDNFEDAYSISESFAKRMRSQHAYQHEQEWDEHDRQGKGSFVSLFPGKFPRTTLANLDDDGIIKPGTVVQHGDPLVLVARRRERAHNQVTRAKGASFADKTLLWEHHAPGVVTDAVKTARGVTVAVKSISEMQEGDKLSNKYGGKGLVKIVPDEQMPHDAQGRPYEVLANPLGVITRGNPSQVIEAVLGKVAAQTGKPYKLDSFQGMDSLAEFAYQEAKKHGISDTETITDPVSGRKIPNVLTGMVHFLKLHHVAEAKVQGRDIGSYTAEGQPSKGGSAGSKRVSLGDTLALLSHGANATVRDARLFRGQQHFEGWANFMAGKAMPEPQVPFVHTKFFEQLKAAGINPVRRGGRVQLFSMTDKDVDAAAGEHEIEHGGTVDWKHGLKELPGGLFDETATGGHGAKQWSKITLAEPMVNPIFEEPARRLLGLTEKRFRLILAGREQLDGSSGPAAIKAALGKIDVDKGIDQARAEVASGRRSVRDDAVRRWGVLKNLKEQGRSPADWVLSKVPVLPPAYRPVSIMAGSKTPLVSDSNYLYGELLDANANLKALSAQSADTGPERLALYNAFKAVVGLGEPTSKKSQDSGVQGILRHVFGHTAKFSSMQRSLLSGTVDLVGRGTVVPNTHLDMDQVGLPEERAWDVYRPFVVRRLVRHGVAPLQAMRQVADKTPLAKAQLLQEMSERPVVVTRAPTLHKYNLMSFWPQLVQGDAIHVNPFVTKGFAMDYDGDQSNFHVPFSPEAVEEARTKLLPSQNLFSAKELTKTHQHPINEFAAGLYYASTEENTDKPVRVFATRADAIRAHQQGQIGAADRVRIIQD